MIRLVTAVLAVAIVATALGGPLAAQSAEDRAAVLAANAEFYRAFREGDMAAMDAVWGEEEPIAVEHPSSWREVGRARVLASWSLILRRPPPITCEVEGLSFEEGRALVLCLEHLNPGQVRMLNVFHREGGAWKMIYHGPAPDLVTRLIFGRQTAALTAPQAS